MAQPVALQVRFGAEYSKNARVPKKSLSLIPLLEFIRLYIIFNLDDVDMNRGVDDIPFFKGFISDEYKITLNHGLSRYPWENELHMIKKNYL